MPKHLPRGHLTIVAEHSPDLATDAVVFLRNHGASVLELGTHRLDAPSDDAAGLDAHDHPARLAVRVAFEAPDLPRELPELRERFAEQFAPRYGADFTVAAEANRMRVAILVSKPKHCLRDLLDKRAHLPIEIVQVISNHETLGPIVEQEGIKFSWTPIAEGTRARVETQQIDLIVGADVDLIIMARYMQILSPWFIATAGVPILNIHHGDIPGFEGSDPYQRAWDLGITSFAATAHYATAKLDGGPVIYKEAADLSYCRSAAETRVAGQATECRVLTRAVQLHSQGRVVRGARRTYIFR